MWALREEGPGRLPGGGGIGAEELTLSGCLCAQLHHRDSANVCRVIE